MALTFTTLKQAIQDYCESNETTFVANLPLIIRQAEDRILKNVQLPDFRKNVNGQVQINNEYLEIPTDFLAPYSLAVDNSGYEYLTLKDVSSIREMYPVSTSTGVPKYYAIFDDSSFILGPTPDAGYIVELHYFYKPTSITNSADGTSWLGNNAESALLYGCLVEAYTFLKGDQDLLVLYSGRYTEALERIKGVGEGYSTTDSYRSGDVRTVRS
jgi:hypothetical protein